MPTVNYTQGQTWQMGVAVDVKNRRFAKGTRYSNDIRNSISTGYLDSFDALCETPYYYLDDLLQFGDKLSVSTLGESITGAFYTDTFELESTNTIRSAAPVSGSIYPRQSDHTHNFPASSPFTAYGTGRAAGWYMTSGYDYCGTEGIRRGLVQRGNNGRSAKNAIVTRVENISGLGTYVSTLKVTLAEGEYLLGLYKDNAGGYEARNTTRSTNDAGYINLVDSRDGSGFGYCRVQGQSTWTVNDAVSGYCHIGALHIGGYRKPFAQKITVPASRTCVFSQPLVSSGMDAVMRSTTDTGWKYSELVKNAYYRLCLTYRIQREKSTTTITNCYVSGGLNIGNHAAAIDQNFGTITPTFIIGDTGWQHWISDPLRISEWETRQTGVAPMLNLRLTFAGTDRLNFYFDNIVLEHAGNLTYPTDGCLDFARYNVWPAGNSITWDLQEVADRRADSADGTSDLVDATGSKYDKRYVIKATFENVSQEFWDDLDRLMDWQRKGHLITLHPALNDLPAVLVGEIEIDQVQKNFWDLRKRSFALTFIEIV